MTVITAERLRRLDTPSLLLDGGVLQDNLARAQRRLGANGPRLRPVVSAHRCPELAQLQLAADGTPGGVAVWRVSEAEAMFAAGITDIVVAGPVVGRDRLDRLARLVPHGTVQVVLRSVEQVAELADGRFPESGRLGALLAVGGDDEDVGFDRAGLRSACQLLSGSPHAQMAGLFAQTAPDATTEDATRQAHQLLSAADDSRQDGHAVPNIILMTDETTIIEAPPAGLTEICAATYLFGQGGTTQALWVVGTIVSVPRPGVAISDCGQKALAVRASELPAVEWPGAFVEKLHAEHGLLRLSESAVRMRVGDRILFRPNDPYSTNRLYRTIDLMSTDGHIRSMSMMPQGRHD